MASRARLIQALACLVVVSLVVGAGLLHGPLTHLRQTHELALPYNTAGRLNVLTIAPGGFRAIIINYLWITSNQLKQEGRIFDAVQRANLICEFQPRFPAVWTFQAWNMAWNISVTAHTPDERWLWVQNGIRLLRDKGIPYNPKSVTLYQELAWIFFSKMASDTDQMHMTYKRRWAVEMQELLGGAPFGETEKIIDAFRPNAEAPLDKTVSEQGKTLIQAEQRDKLRQEFFNAENQDKLNEKMDKRL